ncbi:hypothetical protein [Paenibacillus luteus]|uniref:hypothetical protein n=1 Tax=Paenibacillus luteus TaxID=2545753 RepID=UPI001144D493|nr:hypothetical protein [Paenibacillus luteus]
MIKKRLGVIFACLLAAILGGCAVHHDGGKESIASNVHADEIVAKVNGEPIRLGELALLMARKRSETIRYFFDTYQAEDSAEYWTTDYEGERPIDWLKAAALEEAVRIKVQQIIAKDEGIVERIDYTAFREDWQKENERRLKAAEKKELLYGPLQYEENTYYDYLFSNMVLQYKEMLRERDGLSVAEGERRYEEQVTKGLGSAAKATEWEVYNRIETQ